MGCSTVLMPPRVYLPEILSFLTEQVIVVFANLGACKCSEIPGVWVLEPPLPHLAVTRHHLEEYTNEKTEITDAA